jgi:hypothetical protein
MQTHHNPPTPPCSQHYSDVSSDSGGLSEPEEGEIVGEIKDENCEDENVGSPVQPLDLSYNGEPTYSPNAPTKQELKLLSNAPAPMATVTWPTSATDAGSSCHDQLDHEESSRSSDEDTKNTGSDKPNETDADVIALREKHAKLQQKHMNLRQFVKDSESRHCPGCNCDNRVKKERPSSSSPDSSDDDKKSSHSDDNKKRGRRRRKKKSSSSDEKKRTSRSSSPDSSDDNKKSSRSDDNKKRGRRRKKKSSSSDEKKRSSSSSSDSSSPPQRLSLEQQNRIIERRRLRQLRNRRRVREGNRRYREMQREDQRNRFSNDDKKASGPSQEKRRRPR